MIARWLRSQARKPDPAMIAIGVMVAIVAVAMADRVFSVLTFPYDLIWRPWMLL
jgi:hypothetical protein